MRPRVQQVATVIEYREIYDRAGTLAELISLTRDLDPTESLILLCQMNAELRLARRARESVARLQQEMAGALLSDEVIQRAKARFGTTHLSDRPVFYPPQVLNVAQIVAEHSRGTLTPLKDESARYALGDACLMMTDLMMTAEERLAVKTGEAENIAKALMVQSLGPFEVQNPAPIQHVAYRSRIMFHDLLRNESVLQRIRQYKGFDIKEEFRRITRIPLHNWLMLMFGFHAYFMHYLDKDGTTRHPEFLALDRLVFGQGTPIDQSELDLVLGSISTNLSQLRNALQVTARGDWRFDSVPFRDKPLIQLNPGKFYCFDLGLLVEKIHSGIYWIIHEGLSRAERWNLSGAWGVLFEEYVNSFLAERNFKDFLFWPSPKWDGGGECLDGALMRNSVFIPMEYKGGFLLRAARYSGNRALVEKELESKIVDGCNQLARNIGTLFSRDRKAQQTLKNIPVEHVTRVVPLLVVQDHILDGPLVNWYINSRFNAILDKTRLRPGVSVDPLTVAGIRELETMADSAELGTFDLFGSLQTRCYRDPEMRSSLHNVLLECPGYGDGISPRIRDIIDSLFDDVTEHLFGKRQFKSAAG